MLNRLTLALNIRPTERDLVGLLLLHSFFVGLVRILANITGYTLFLENYSAQMLPYVYIAAAVINSLGAIVFSSLEKRLSFRAFLLINLGIQVFSLFAFRLLFAATNEPFPAMAFVIWVEVLGVLTSLEFWGLTGRLFDLRQAKRLFGLVGAGEVIPIIMISILGPLFITLMGIENLLLVASVGVMISILLASYILSRFPIEMQEDEPPTEEHGIQAAFSIFKNRYVILVIGLAIASHTAFFFADNIFYSRLSVQYPDSTQVGTFLSIFFAAIGLVSLLNRVLISEPIITRYGVGGALLVLPGLLIISSILLATAGIVDSSLAVIFILASGMKLLDEGTRYSTYRSARLVLYQPLSPKQQTRMLSLIESVVEPVTGGVIGLVLLILVNVLTFGWEELNYVLGGILIIWVAVTLLVSREYTQIVLQAVKRRRLGANSISFTDSASIAVIKQNLDSADPLEILYSLNVLENVPSEPLDDILIRLLKNPDPMVRQDVLKRLEARRVMSALPSVMLLAKQEQHVAVRAEAVRTLAALGEDDVFTELSAALKSHHEQIRHGAIIGLLRNGGIEGVLAAGQQLITLADSPQAADRVHAAQILGEIGIRNFYRPLIKLIQDQEPTVRIAALLSAGKLKNPNLWQYAIPYLAASQTRTAAIFALSNADSSVIPYFEAAFADKTTSPRTLIGMARACGQIGGKEMVDFLFRHAIFPELNVRLKILSALSRGGFRARTKETKDRVEAGIRDEVANAAYILQVLIDLSPEPDTRRLQNALENELLEIRQRIFLWLSFTHDSYTILQARANLASEATDKRAYALEALDQLLERDLKTLVLPLMDDTPHQQQLTALGTLFPQKPASLVDHLKIIIIGDQTWTEPWLRASAIYVAARLNQKRLTDSIIAVIKDPNPIVAETAIWSLHKLAPGIYTAYLGELQRSQQQIDLARLHTIGVVNETIGMINKEMAGGKYMLLTIEKVLILKGVSIFSETPQELLAEIATVLGEVGLEPGETIIKKGDVANAMYIIVEGQIKVHNEDQIVAEMKDRDVFGELSLLDDEPRSASITATAPTRLLRLERHDFQEIINDYPEVSHGIMRVLSRRLRNMIQT